MFVRTVGNKDKVTTNTMYMLNPCTHICKHNTQYVNTWLTRPYRVYSQGVSRRMRIKFLGYLPCTIVAWVENSWCVVCRFQPWRRSNLPLPNIYTSSIGWLRYLPLYKLIGGCVSQINFGGIFCRYFLFIIIHSKWLTFIALAQRHALWINSIPIIYLKPVLYFWGRHYLIYLSYFMN